MSFQVILQHDETDCAAACLAMISRHHGKRIAINRIRNLAGTDKMGTTGFGLVKAAQALGFLCKGVVSPDKSIRQDLPFPFIAHVKQNVIDHYVIVRKVKTGRVYCVDPAKGSLSFTFPEFQQLWSGIFFILVPEQHFEKTKETKGLFSRFLHLMIPHKGILAEVFVASVLLTILGVLSAFYYRFLIDEVLFTGTPEMLTTLSLGFALVLLFQAILSFSRGQLMLVMANKIDGVLIFQYFQHVLRLPMSFFNGRKTGEILSRLGDTETIRQAISGTTMTLLLDTVMLVIGGAFLFLFSIQLVFIAIIPVILSTLLVWLFSGPFRKMILRKAVIDAERQSILVESLNGISTVKALSTEGEMFNKAESKIVASIDRGMQLGFWGNFQATIQGFFSQAGNLAVFWVGSSMILQGQLSLGELISFNTLLGYFLGPLGRLITLQPALQEAFVASDRLGEILDIDDEKEGDHGNVDMATVLGSIRIQNLNFSYGTRGATLKKINLTINAGEKVAFVGPSGSGKTTLTKLILKFFPFESGDIFIDDYHIKDLRTESLRNSIGYVPQEILLFSGTIAENIAWGQPWADPSAIIQAAVQARAHDFISKLPDRYSTMVGERGATLSGGERQRIALARVLLRKPRLLILDEATSSLDSLSERAIMDTLREVDTGATIILVAHRLSTIMDCSRIFVFRDGEVIEQGSHSELMSRQGVYTELWESQNGGRE